MKRATVIFALLIASAALALSAIQPPAAEAKKPALWCAGFAHSIGYHTCFSQKPKCEKKRKKMTEAAMAKCVKTRSYNPNFK